jgi:predicted glutamine amidotransferase
MCELMGLSLDRPASAHFSIREFGSRDSQNVDGWGLAWYPDHSAAIVKEPVSWRASEHTGFLEKYHALRSCLYIAHVRHKTVGGKPTHADTHPFVRELAGREYTFAHNGTLKGLEAGYSLGRFVPLGVTDSEYVFCHLLAKIGRRGHALSTTQDYGWLHRQLRRINQAGELNCLFSDGSSLFGYHDVKAYKGLVWCPLSIPGHHSERLADGEMQLSFEGHQHINGFAVATHPLGNYEWRSFEPGELIVAQKGKVQYSSCHNLREEIAAA